MGMQMNRRQFLKALGLSTGAAAAATVLPRSVIEPILESAPDSDDLTAYEWASSDGWPTASTSSFTVTPNGGDITVRWLDGGQVIFPNVTGPPRDVREMLRDV